MSLPALSDRTKRKKFSAGQALLEYVLLLSLVTAIILGSIYQFNAGFRQFASNYFGSYLRCLLETGELPRSGYDGEEGICDESYQAFTFAEGRPPRDLGGGSQDSGRDAVRENAAPQNAQVDSETGGVAGRGSDEGGSGGGNVPAGRMDPLGSSGREGAPERVALLASEKKAEDGVNQVENRAGGFGQGTTSSSGVSERGRAPLNQAENKALSATKQSALEEEGPNRRKGARVPAESAAFKKLEDVDAPDFSISFWLRLILVILIILAILFFVGGQVLQFVKSREKGDGT